MIGVGITVKFNPLLAYPSEDTVTLNVPDTFVGTTAVREVFVLSRGGDVGTAEGYLYVVRTVTKIRSRNRYTVPAAPEVGEIAVIRRCHADRKTQTRCWPRRLPLPQQDLGVCIKRVEGRIN